MNFLTTYFFNLTLLNYLFNFLDNLNNGIILQSAYSNLQQDLSFIRFPGDINFSYFIYSIPIALLVSLVYKKFIAFNFEFDELEVIINKFLKLTLVNTAVLTSAIYFLRLYELLSRIYVLIFLILFPIVMIIFESILQTNKIQKLQTKFNLINIGLLSIFIAINSSLYNYSIDNIINSNKIQQDKIIESQDTIKSLNFKDENVLNLDECNEWVGSGSYTGCISVLEVTSNQFDMQITNLVTFEGSIYFILKDGLIYKQKSKGSDLELFLNISDKVYTEFPGLSQGLYSLAFNPNGKEFLVSYSNDDIALVFEKYYIGENNLPKSDASNELLRISNNVKFHFGGSIIWSEYFDGYLVGIGDMRENIMPLVHSDSINTTSFKGKVILLDSEKTLSVPLINEHGLYESIDKIVAYGLRNPWQLTEYNERLFITDVGSQFIEELNEIKYKEVSKENNINATSFGWPILMGDKLSYSFNERNKDALTKLDGNISDLYIWGSNEYEKADNYIINNSKAPLLQYDHYVDDDTIRAAIIGGGIIKDKDSKYNNLYFFTDYVENELYGVDIDTKNLFIFPLPQIGNPTSLKISPFEKDSILVGFTNGTLLEIKLP
jgi:hypothetical protein